MKLMTFKDYINKFTYTTDSFSYCNNTEVNTNEMLDSNIDVDYYIPYVRDNSKFIRGVFRIDNLEFNIIFELITESEWIGLGINFERVSDGKVFHSTLNDLNTKQVLQVFSTVVKESKHKISKYKPDTIYVSTDEPTKLNTYKKLISKLNPGGYDINETNNSVVLSRVDSFDKKKFIFDKFKDIK